MDLDSLVWVGLGGNAGEVRENLTKGLEIIRARPEVIRGSFLTSSIYASAPLNCPPGSPEFLNMVCGFLPRKKTTPEAFLEFLLGVEKLFGRKRSGVPNEPRPLDLDLLAFGRIRQESPFLHLPHPRACERSFVLLPMVEVASGYIFPGMDRTVAEIWSEFSNTEGIKMVFEQTAQNFCLHKSGE